MNRLALIAVTGALTLMLTACGEQGSSKPAEGQTTTTTTQTTTPEAPKAAPEEAPAAGGENH